MIKAVLPSVLRDMVYSRKKKEMFPRILNQEKTVFRYFFQKIGIFMKEYLNNC